MTSTVDVRCACRRWLQIASRGPRCKVDIVRLYLQSLLRPKATGRLRGGTLAANGRRVLLAQIHSLEIRIIMCGPRNLLSIVSA